MAQNIIRKRDFSFQGVRREGPGYRTKALLIFLACFCVDLQVTTQYIASAFEHHPALGWNVPVKGYPVYPFYRAVHWLYILLSNYDEALAATAVTSACLFSTGMMLSACAARRCYMKGRNESLESLHGSAHWATLREIQGAGLLDEGGEPFDEGVVVGGVRVGGEVKMMRHGGREHVLCYAPTRSGKGISLVLPTLLDGWKQSVFVLDIKKENYVRP